MQLAESLSALAAQGVGGRPVVVRNALNGIAVFTDEQTKITNQWAAIGDPHGKDVLEVSPSILANPQFREMVLRGIFTIEESPEVLQAALDAQRAHWQSRQLQAANASVEIEKSKDTVIATGASCIAPKGRELCGSYALVMGKDVTSHPPLCTEHMTLARNYASTETGRIIEGKPEVIWRRVTLAQA